ncbi:hypothetical protein E2562_026365 [Oryza meyeriana var. granulata]|uniref:Uncharacterized protein n=1 Tax=Oryza meyeriana var. granulata TaxID=110450 RepID=A0A6G1EZ22_9ORYZ|nr:hypothetical protein E2562_026365 [Oryza meyeriana var. granulata]
MKFMRKLQQINWPQKILAESPMVILSPPTQPQQVLVCRTTQPATRLQIDRDSTPPHRNLPWLPNQQLPRGRMQVQAHQGDSHQGDSNSSMRQHQWYNRDSSSSTYCWVLQVKLWDTSSNQPSCIASLNPKVVIPFYIIANFI